MAGRTIDWNLPSAKSGTESKSTGEATEDEKDEIGDSNWCAPSNCMNPSNMSCIASNSECRSSLRMSGVSSVTFNSLRMSIVSCDRTEKCHGQC